MVTMHQEKIGFCLVPCGFFNSTPAIDLPRPGRVQSLSCSSFAHTGPEGEQDSHTAEAAAGGGPSPACGSCPPSALPGTIPAKL